MTLSVNGADSISYSGSQAKKAQDIIAQKIEAATEAYENAFKEWNGENGVVTLFTLGSTDNTEGLFSGIVNVSRKELDKTGQELEELAKGINNINESWVDLSNDISETLRQYGTSPDGVKEEIK